ncbi:hypothetical protein DDB_G0290341 [Dictyostelium discoideum AX4]|uniref:Vesicle transport protein n=1 Tax=Dictyostelium discoideum TaxID=44689 RepID=Q54G72_DICDI|nr:hypothetical protein DDB_G0290341 [Dictyostelium discoideum AX4]EAL62297.1 hypothetical protein DDB_G0290341 [Dictyostelium discoideum AX4]|eukprot:XP_635811.1 hypothetical protein DDB_G0290341 [Dictyostelium discoideum AX4]
MIDTSQLDVEFKTNSSVFSSFKSTSGQYWNDISNTGDGFLSKIKSNIPGALGGTTSPAESKTFYQELQESSSLTYFQRLTGFVICLVIGIIFLGMSTMVLFIPRQFAKFYSLGSLSIIIGLVILVGVKKQIANIMSSKERLYSTILYIGSIFATIYFALSLQSTILTLIFVVIQFITVIWYSLSYIPFGQSMITGTFSTVFKLFSR